MNFEQNERLEEWFLIVGDWFRATNKRWFMALGLVILLAIPGYLFISYTFSNLLIAAVNPSFRVNYDEVVKLPLEVTEKKVINYGNGTYAGYAKIKNQNSDWGVPGQKYEAVFKAGGSTVMVMAGETFILPFTEKILVFPRFESSSTPTSLELSFSPTTFIRPPNISSGLTLEIQRRNIELGAEDTIVTAVIVNRTPFKISRVDLPLLLFDNKNQIMGAGYTNINDLESNESRSFQYTWFSRINNVSRIEILPELNVYNRNLFILSPGQNPFDPEEEED